VHLATTTGFFGGAWESRAPLKSSGAISGSNELHSKRRITSLRVALSLSLE